MPIRNFAHVGIKLWQKLPKSGKSYFTLQRFNSPIIPPNVWRP